MNKQDLNLLMVFDAIMTEKSFTRAAERMEMTQPAVSNAVSRMRCAWDDPLFVKEGRGIQPTARALSLWHQVKGPIEALKDAINSPHCFDPQSTRRCFRVVVSDVMVNVLWQPLRQLIEREAPHINLYAIPPHCIANNKEKLLEDAAVDLVIAPCDGLGSGIRTRKLFDSNYVIAMRSEHPLAEGPLTLERYLEADHLLVSLSGDSFGMVDQILQQQGLSRRVAVTVNHFNAAERLLMGTDLISALPGILVGKRVVKGELYATQPPFELPTKIVSVAWHVRNDRDPALRWFVNKIQAFAEQEWNKYSCACPGHDFPGD